MNGCYQKSSNCQTFFLKNHLKICILRNYMIRFVCQTNINMNHTNHDPLIELEEEIQITHTKTKQSTFTKILKKTGKWIKFLAIYFSLTGIIFSVLMGFMNFSAYSARVSNWINPDAIAWVTENMKKILLNSSVEVNAASWEDEEENENRWVIEEKIAITNPEMVFSRTYNEQGLLAGISHKEKKQTTFNVAPLENRVIIPKLWKNIPLLDVDHDKDASFTEMNEVFMEELKKGIVRYPGTAKPGEKGNAFIFGHSSNFPWIKSQYNDVFALLDTLENGDEIIVYYEQKKYLYRVTDRAIITPGDKQIFETRDPNKKEISLMTCWPIGTTLERIIIFGELSEIQ